MGLVFMVVLLRICSGKERRTTYSGLVQPNRATSETRSLEALTGQSPTKKVKVRVTVTSRRAGAKPR